jgi:putative flippase GtrA
VSGRVDRLAQRLPRVAVLSKFAFTGALVAITHLGLVSGMTLGGVPIQIALALAFLVAIAMHFTLNRQWVFRHESGYALRFSSQGLRYLAAAALSYACTAIGVAVLPDALGIPQLAAFFLMTGIMACITFAILHLWVFHTHATGGAS